MSVLIRTPNGERRMILPRTIQRENAKRETIERAKQARAIRDKARAHCGGHSARSRTRASDAKSRANNIAIFDTETNPFDNTKPDERIVPFLGVIYADEFPPIVIWNENFVEWLKEVADAFNSLPAPYTIYAHNGGKFDWMFLLSLLSGRVQFKGSALMRARYGRHELRDSLHILPVKLSAISKEEIDYSYFTPELRNQHRPEITSYCISDCANLLPAIKEFRAEHGDALTIGGAAIKALTRIYPDIGTFGEATDEYFRHFYFGGRVELIAPKGHYTGAYKLYDINSSYPNAMANYKHPISSTFDVFTNKPAIRPDTAFIELECDNRNALLSYDPETNTLTSSVKHGIFHTTIHEYNMALNLGLISNIKLRRTIDFHEFSDFSKFIIPLYETRAALKERLEATPDDKILQGKSLRTKLLLNNAYGRFAINPRKFKDMELCLLGFEPELEGATIHLSCPEYTIYARPALHQKFSNVATAASITGAARAELMLGISRAENPIYCDTDSIICTALDMPLDQARLGAWSLEAEFTHVHIAAKKLYAARNAATGKEKVRAKGANTLTYTDIVDIVDGKSVTKTLNSPTFKADGTQRYLTRTLGAT